MTENKKKACKPFKPVTLTLEDHVAELEDHVAELEEENRKIKGINKGLNATRVELIKELEETKSYTKSILTSYDGVVERKKGLEEELAHLKNDIEVALNERDRQMHLRNELVDELEKVKAESKGDYDELYIEVENLRATNENLGKALEASQEETALADYKRNVLLESIKSLAQTSQFLGGDK